MNAHFGGVGLPGVKAKPGKAGFKVSNPGLNPTRAPQQNKSVANPAAKGNFAAFAAYGLGLRGAAGQQRAPKTNDPVLQAVMKNVEQGMPAKQGTSNQQVAKTSEALSQSGTMAQGASVNLQDSLSKYSKKKASGEFELSDSHIDQVKAKIKGDLGLAPDLELGLPAFKNGSAISLPDSNGQSEMVLLIGSGKEQMKAMLDTNTNKVGDLSHQGKPISGFQASKFV